MKRWLKSLRNLFAKPTRRPSRRTRPASRLLLEELECRLTPAPVITTIAGNGSYGYNGDGSPATAAMLYLPFGTAVDPSGNVYIADTYNSRIREVVQATGNILTVAGTGNAAYNGDGGPATQTNIGRPYGVAADGSGNLFIADWYNNRIREVVKSTGAMITIAGTGATGYGGDGGPATAAMLNAPDAVAVDGSGNVFFSDQGNNRVREVVKATGTIITVAGTGGAGYNGDGEQATAAMLNQPNGVAVDSAGNVYISDWHNNRVREVVKTNRAIITVAGTGAAGYGGDGGPATAAQINYPGGVAVDAGGNVFIGDSFNNRVREVVQATGIITTVAGTGATGYGGDGGSATAALLDEPNGVAVDASGNVYIADSYNYRIREVINSVGLGGLSSSAWTVSTPGYSPTVAITGGTAPYGSLVAAGLPPGLTASLNGSTITLSGTPTGIGTFSNVTLSVQDSAGSFGSRTYTITINPLPSFGALSVTQWTAQVEGYSGSIPVTGGTGPLTLAFQANLPPGLTAVVSGSAIYPQGIPSTPGTYNNIQLTVRDATGATGSGTYSMTITAPAAGSILTVAGIDLAGYSGDGGPANQARLYDPESVAVDSGGNVFIADFYNSRIREIVKATGNIVTVAGTGVNGFSGDGGPATSAQVYYPTGVAVDTSGNVFIADNYNHRIREILKATGNMITVAGNGSSTDSGDGGPATSAGIAQPEAVTVDANGNVFIADASGNRIREVVKATGAIITVAGTGMPGSSGDNGPATAATLNNPNGVAVDGSGNLYIADSGNNRVREVVKATGNIITIAGTGTHGYSGDNGPATSAQLYYPMGVAVDPYGSVFIADTYNSRIRVIVQSSGTILTYAGTGTSGYGGDGGPAGSGNLNFPYALGLDGSGNLFIADTYNNVVREVLPIPAPILGALSPTQWTVNQSYSGYIPVTGGAPPSGSFLTTSGMPPGLTASANVTSAGNISSITITGTPTAAGIYSANLTVRGPSGAPQASRTYTITINAAPALGTLSYAQWIAGVPGYIGTIPVSGGTTPGLTLVSQANLPPGLTATLRGTSITFTGIPTTTGTYGNVQFTVRDGAGATASGTYSITINAPSPGSILTFAGGSYPGYGGDGGPANLAGLYYPAGVAVDGNGNVFIADSYDNRIREVVKATGNIITVAGAGAPVYGGDGGPATSATLYHPTGVAVDAGGDIFIADLSDNRVREVIAATGTIVTVAGNGSATESGDGGPATAAGLNAPEGVAVDAAGNLFIADASGNRVREVIAATGTIITVAGTGTYGYGGDNGPATAAMLYEPTAVAVDGGGNLFIADTYNDRIREVVQATGTIITIAGTGSVGYGGDGGPATAARLNYPFGVFVDGSGNVFIGDTYNSRIREVLQYSGNIVTVAGTGSAGYMGDGGPATSARLYYPNGVATDGSGNLFIGDTDNNVVREVLASPVLGALSSTTWTVNQPGFSATIPVTSVAPPSGSVVSATGLPAGLSAALSGTTVSITGTPTASGTYGSVVVSILSATGTTLASRTYSITINPAPALGTLGPQTQWTAGQTGYAGTIPTSGGTGTLTLTSQANVPPGLTAVLNGTTITISGTPTTAGTYSNIQLSVQDTTGATSTATYSLTINPTPALGVLSATAWTVSQPGFSGTVSVLGGTAPYGNLTATGLPDGLSATLSGTTITISGTPTTAGTYNNIQLSIADTTGATSTATYSLTINPAPTLGALSSTVWTANQAGFSGTVSVSGGTTPYGNLTATGLPPGLSATLSGNTITVSGTPTAAGTYNNIQLSVQDLSSATATGTFSITINPALTLGALSTTAWTVNQPGFSSSVIVSGGTAPVGNLTATGLPPGLSATLSGTTIAISGTPSSVGTYSNVQLSVQDTTGATSTATYAITINPAPTLGALSTTAWTVNQSGFSGTVNVSGGTAPYGNLTATGLPPGLSATESGNTITISGTPTTSGTYGNVQLSAQDTTGAASTATYSLTINPAPTLGVLSATAWTVNQANFSSTVSVSGGTAPYGSLTATGLPPGLSATLSGDTIAISGTPTTAGTYGNVQLSVQDATGATSTATYSLTINPAPTLGALSATVWTANQAGFSGTVSVSGGTAPYGSLTATGLPPGLSATQSGSTITISGTPTAAGTYSNVQLSVQDMTGATSAATYSITINPAPTLGALSATAWTVNQAGLSGTVSISGGTTPYGNLSATGLPPGLSATQSGNTIIISGTPTAAGTYNNVQLSVQDAVLATASRMFSITINPAPTLGALSPAAWSAYQPGFNGTMSISGGTAAYRNLSITGLPSGLTATLGGNTISISGTPTAVGAYYISASVRDSAGAVASAASILTVAGPAVTFGLTNYPTAVTAGATESFTVTALDANGFVATAYQGTVYLGSSDPLTGAPTTYTFTAADAGVHTFSFTLETAGSQQLYAKDANGLIGFSGPITVSPAAVDHFVVAAPPYPAAYYALNVTATAQDAYNNTVSGYTGTVHFTSSDGAAILPADYTYTGADQGSHAFAVTWQTTGTQTVTVNDSNKPAATGTATVQVLNYIPGLHFVVSPSVTTTTAGAPFDVTLTALDQSNNVAVHYVGTVSFSTSDRGSGVVLPANYTFTAADAGVHTFAGGVTLVTAGNQSLLAVDISTVASGGYGLANAGITVIPAAASALAITGLPATVTRGAAQALTVSARDPYGNTATSYSGTVHFTSSDPQAVLPPDTALSGGAGTFQVVLGSLGTQSLSVTDTANSALTATQAITVNPAPAVRLAVTGFPSATTAGVAGTFSVTAFDTYGYVASGYSGTVHFTSSDPQAVLPANATLTNGTGSFSATLKTAGTQSLMATDTTNGSLSATEGGISVTPAAAATLTLAGFPTGITAGLSGTMTVTARDAYGNVATGYAGTVHFTSSDPQAALPADYTFAAADQGVHTFAATLKTAGSQSLAVADTAGGLAGGSEGGITVSAAAAVQLVGTAPASTTAGANYTFTVRALDAFGNQATGYRGTVHFSSSDPRAALGTDYTYTAADAGRALFVVWLTTAGNQTLTVSDTGSAGVSGTQFTVSVAAGATTALVLSGFPATVTAGVAQPFTVTAVDAYGNTTTGYTGTVRFSSGDSRAVLPANYTFTAADAGTHSFSAALITAGSQALFVQDTVQYSISGIYWSTVTPAAATWIAAGYPSTTTAGTAQNLTVYAFDPYGNVATGYRGTVHVTSFDAQATLPADYTFTAADAGVHALPVTLKTAGLQGITVQDVQNGFTGHVSAINVIAAAASRLKFGGFPTSTTAGTSGSLTVTAYDAYGNVATGYAGTVHFTSSDAQAGLPANYTFTSGDQGTHTFAASLKTAGTQSLGVTDTANAGLAATQTGISVVAGAASRFVVSGYPATTAGTSHSLTVTALDAYGNVATGYRGTVHFTSSDGQAALPSNYTFTAGDNGVHTFSATLKTAGSQSLTATDTVTSSITGSQSGIVVTAAAATHFVITAPANVSVGVAFSVTVTALDAYGNIATGYLGTVHFTSSDHKAILPSDYTFVAGDAGVHTFLVTFKSTGTLTLTVADTHTTSIKGSASVKVL